MSVNGTRSFVCLETGLVYKRYLVKLYEYALLCKRKLVLMKWKRIVSMLWFCSQIQFQSKYWQNGFDMKHAMFIQIKEGIFWKNKQLFLSSSMASWRASEKITIKYYLCIDKLG